MHYSKSTIDEVRRTDMIDFLGKYKNLSFKKQGADYRCMEHSSLVVKGDRVRWFWNSKSTGGTGAIDFLIKIESLTFPESISILTGSVVACSTTYNSKKVEPKIFFSLPDKEELSPSKLIKYLCEKRGISNDIVFDLMKKDKIYQDKRGNIVFVGVDENNNPRFASMRGTGEKHFRMDCNGSDKKYSFHLKGSSVETLYIFESPIDALSYATLENFKQNCNSSWEKLHYLSLGGTSHVALDSYLLRTKDVKKLVLCLDNDDAGLEATGKIIEKYAKSNYEVSTLLPESKDFNDELMNFYKYCKI